MWSDTSEDAVISDARRNLKQKVYETSICGQANHQMKCPRNDETPCYTKFHIQRRNARHIVKDSRNAGLMNNNVICYANAIFQVIASCNHLSEFLLNPPREEHQRFSLYCQFACVIRPWSARRIWRLSIH